MWTCGRALMDAIQKLVETNILFTGSSPCQLFCQFCDFIRRVWTQQSVQISCWEKLLSLGQVPRALYACLRPVSTSAATYGVTSTTVGYDIIRSHFCIAVTSPCFALISHFQYLTPTPWPYSSLSRSVKHTVERFTFDFLKAMTTRLLQTQTMVQGDGDPEGPDEFHSDLHKIIWRTLLFICQLSVN